MSMILKRSERR